MLVHPNLEPLIGSVPWVNEWIVLPPPGRSWWGRAVCLGNLLKSKRFDAAIVSNPSKELHVAVWLAGIPQRVGYDRKWGGLLTDRIPDEKALGVRHEVEYNFELLKPLGITVPAKIVLDLPVCQQAKDYVAQLLGGLGVARQPLVAVHPWTSNPKKQWPLERFRTVVQALVQRDDSVVAVIGGPEEQAQAHTILGPSDSRVLNLVGRLSLPELAALLQRARVLVTNDSGPMHVAAAVGTPVVALFGTADAGSHPRRWGPWGSGHTVIHKPLEQINVEEVVRAASAYLT